MECFVGDFPNTVDLEQHKMIGEGYRAVNECCSGHRRFSRYIDQVYCSTSRAFIAGRMTGENLAVFLERPGVKMVFSKSFNVRRWQECLSHVGRIICGVTFEIMLERGTHCVMSVALCCHRVLHSNLKSIESGLELFPSPFAFRQTLQTPSRSTCVSTSSSEMSFSRLCLRSISA
jgi:hypothetical protein